MSGNITSARGGEFATSRRGGLGPDELTFITANLGRYPVAAIAKMLGRPLATVRQHIAALTPRAAPVIEIAPAAQRADEIGDLIREVAALHKLTPEDILGDAVRRNIVVARHHAMWAAYNIRQPDGTRRRSLPQLGQRFNRDHSTVFCGVRSHQERVERGDLDHILEDGVDSSCAAPTELYVNTSNREIMNP